MVSQSVNKELCLRCKGGKFLCGLRYCPITIKNKALMPIKKSIPKLKNEYYGPSPPSIFVGRFGYPKVYIGPMAAFDWDNVNIIDEPDQWGTKYSLEKIVNLRARLFRFMGDPIKVTEVASSSKILEITQEQIQAKEPVDLEIKYNKKPKINLAFNPFTQPMGARFKVDTISLSSTPKIDYFVDKVVSDTDLNAVSAVDKLYSTKNTVTQISRLLSAGLLGERANRKFVPTRWSITAVDDILGNKLRERIRDNLSVEDFLVFHNSYLDNDFWVLFIPKDIWQFNYHETWKRGSSWNPFNSKTTILTDVEGPRGRKNYAKNTVGGYYAARLAVLEKLDQMKRKASVIAFREVGKGYAIPLGVWQVRENMRKAMNSPYKKFDSLDRALSFIEAKLTVPMNLYRRKSPILTTRTLDEFFGKNK
ncbi:MAG: Nre family DNA repair protein [Candidatus Hodarchaeales archaeon]